MRSLATLLVLALAASATLAGCTGKSPLSTTTGPGVDVKPTDTTGIIRGVVVDSAIRPLGKVLLTVQTGEKLLTTNSTATGAFGFQDLKPGTYFVVAHKPGFKDVQASADVKAGVAEPATTKLQMEVDSSFVKPYFNVVKHDGFVECTTSAVVLCGAPNLLAPLLCDGSIPGAPPVCVGNLTSDSFTWDQYFEANATLIQSEMVWESTQPVSPELYFEMEPIDAGCTNQGDPKPNTTSGQSPIYTKVFAADIQKYNIGPVCPIYYSIFSGDTPTPATGIPAGVTFNQRFTMIIHSFYGFTPPSAWRFTNDGDPIVPQD